MEAGRSRFTVHSTQDEDDDEDDSGLPPHPLSPGCHTVTKPATIDLFEISGCHKAVTRVSRGVTIGDPNRRDRKGGGRAGLSGVVGFLSPCRWYFALTSLTSLTNQCFQGFGCFSCPDQGGVVRF